MPGSRRTEAADAPDGTPLGDDRPERSDRSPWYWLLLVPLVVVLLPPLYNKTGPELGGIPFFYWYQMATIAIGVTCTLVVYLRTRG